MSSIGDTFLHGSLTVRIIQAKDVHGTNTTLLKQWERLLASSVDGIDPYCTVKLGYNTYLRTKVIHNDSNPYWNSSSTFFVAHEVDELEIRVKTAKRLGPLAIISKVTHLSMLSLSAKELAEKGKISGWFPLTWYKKEQTAENPFDDWINMTNNIENSHEGEDCDLGDIQVEVIYTPIEQYINLPSTKEVGLIDAYYPIRSGINVLMYQDADVPPGTLPSIPFRPNYQHGRCWIDVYKSIMNATKIIYITGWAVWSELQMVRTESDDEMFEDITLGEILKRKAREGVRVCVLVWDEVASNDWHPGIMGTHDEELVKYFKGSKVKFVKVTRLDNRISSIPDINDSLLYTHHQKTVIVSKFDESVGKDRLEAYVGGLDLTDGRYDNPTHSLFRTLKNIHAPPDFWQACALKVGSDSGPREPWHDIHSKLTGSVAWDVLDNFESRWKRQAPNRMLKELYKFDRDEIVSAEEEEEISKGPWNVQILRSISDASTKFDLSRSGLTTRKSHVETSIHDAYIHAIRRAKGFIFLENQYFLGSSHVWRNSNQRGGWANHLVVIELAEKICAKIRAGQRFVVYLIIPMYPEGPPDSIAVQEILSHQRKTVNLITTRIRQTLNEVESDTDVEDWFSIFCLVNRESFEGGQGNGGTDEKEILLSKTRRFMIYVHSKFAVFDDETALVGSANINSRSMNGDRDTEIAAFCWQPDHVASGSTAYGDDTEVELSIPKGDVSAFRCAVWSEHLGEYLDEMEDPSSLECVRKIRELAQANWEAFAEETDEPIDLPHGHLAVYPYKFDSTGEVIETRDNFPDFDAEIKGNSSAIPNLLTG